MQLTLVGESKPFSANSNSWVNEDTLNRTTSGGDNDMAGAEIGKKHSICYKKGSDKRTFAPADLNDLCYREKPKLKK